MVKVRKIKKRLGKRRVMNKVRRMTKRYTKKKPIYRKRYMTNKRRVTPKRKYRRKQIRSKKTGLIKFSKYKLGVMSTARKRVSYKNITVTSSSSLDLVSPTFMYFLNSRKLAVATMEQMVDRAVHNHQISLYQDNRAKLFRDNLLGNGYEGLMENPILDIMKTTLTPHITFDNQIIQLSLYDRFNNNPESCGTLAALLSMTYEQYINWVRSVTEKIAIVVTFLRDVNGATSNYVTNLRRFITTDFLVDLTPDERQVFANVNRAQIYTTYLTSVLAQFFATVYHRAPTDIGGGAVHILMRVIDDEPVMDHRYIDIGQGDFLVLATFRDAVLYCVQETLRSFNIPNPGAKARENVSWVDLVAVANTRDNSRDMLRILYTMNHDDRYRFCRFLAQTMKAVSVSADQMSRLPEGSYRATRLQESPFFDYFVELLQSNLNAQADYTSLHQLVKEGFLRVKFLSKTTVTFKPTSQANSHFYFIGRSNGLKIKTYYKRDLSTLAEVFDKINKNENLRQGLTEEGTKLLRKINPAFNFKMLGAIID
jgi:hypothetical protein